MSTQQLIPETARPASKRHLVRSTLAAVAIFGTGIGIGAAVVSGHTAYRNVPGPTVTVPGPTVTVSPAAPPTGTLVGRWSGSGNETTPSFNAPATGDFIVYWTYSANDGSNFIISDTDSNADSLGLPNDIASSGSGSTEVTGASGDVESFNVQATGSWTIKVVTAP
jgi:hypothetical protein